MIIVCANREPVTVNLSGAFATVGLTLRRLTSADFSAAGASALAIINDSERLESAMVANGLMPEGGVDAWRAMPVADPVAFVAAVTGVSSWLAAVECASRAIVEWSGITSEGGRPANVCREAIESLMLNEDLAEQTQTAIDQAAAVMISVPAGDAK